jgi:DNA-binding NarL/FixJ family response regulator
MNPLRQQHPMAMTIDWNLTGRERQIVDGLLRGFANKDIARQLHVSNQTIKNQLTTLYKKVGVSGRVELVLLAVKRGFVKTRN